MDAKDPVRVGDRSVDTTDESFHRKICSDSAVASQSRKRIHVSMGIKLPGSASYIAHDRPVVPLPTGCESVHGCSDWPSVASCCRADRCRTGTHVDRDDDVLEWPVICPRCQCQ